MMVSRNEKGGPRHIMIEGFFYFSPISAAAAGCKIIPDVYGEGGNLKGAYRTGGEKDRPRERERYRHRQF